MRKFTLLILAIILIGAAAWGVMALLDKSNSDDSTQTAEQSAQQTTQPINDAKAANHVIIKYTDQGFEPSTVTIPEGATVTFMNESSQSMWPASDVHPTHQLYPEFDAKKGLGEGQSYEFTFTKKGSWGFHNHLSAGDTGTIVVE